MRIFLPPLCITKAYLVVLFGAQFKHVSRLFSIISFSLSNKCTGPWRNTRKSRPERPFRKEGSIFLVPQSLPFIWNVNLHYKIIPLNQVYPCFMSCFKPIFFLLAIAIRIVIILQSITYWTLGNVNLYQDVIFATQNSFCCYQKC